VLRTNVLHCDSSIPQHSLKARLFCVLHANGQGHAVIELTSSSICGSIC